MTTQYQFYAHSNSKLFCLISDSPGFSDELVLEPVNLPVPRSTPGCSGELVAGPMSCSGCSSELVAGPKAQSRLLW